MRALFRPYSPRIPAYACYMEAGRQATMPSPPVMLLSIRGSTKFFSCRVVQKCSHFVFMVDCFFYLREGAKGWSHEVVSHDCERSTYGHESIVEFCRSQNSAGITIVSQPVAACSERSEQRSLAPDCTTMAKFVRGRSTRHEKNRALHVSVLDSCQSLITHIRVT